MASEGVAAPVPLAEGAVRLVRWPEERELRERLRAEGTPRLLLVRPPAPAPDVMECEEDWVRLPADDRDVRGPRRKSQHATRLNRMQPKPGKSQRSGSV